MWPKIKLTGGHNMKEILRKILNRKKFDKALEHPERIKLRR